MPTSYVLLGGFAIGARVALLWQHYGNAWQSPAVNHQAHRMPHACRTRTLRMPAKTSLAGDKIDAPATAPFHFVHTAGVVTRTRNVSEYVLVLALCLVLLANVHVRYMLSPVRLSSISLSLSVCLSVTLVHPTQPVEIFGNFSTPFGTMATHSHPGKILRTSS